MDPEEIPLDDLWIIVEDGEAFEGAITHWRDCFFDNASVSTILRYCQDNNLKVRFERISETLSPYAIPYKKKGVNPR